jgi:predicted nuclease with TOPRIM domain
MEPCKENDLGSIISMYDAISQSFRMLEKEREGIIRRNTQLESQLARSTTDLARTVEENSRLSSLSLEQSEVIKKLREVNLVNPFSHHSTQPS